jgi:hypothetical protein
MKAWVIAASLAAALSLAPAAAQGDLTVINNPAEPQVNGTKAKLRDDPAVQGGKAMRVEVRRKGANPWDIAVESTIEQPVKAGDSLVFAFWARLERGEGGATTGTLPYTTLFSARAEIGPEWKLHEVRGKADADHAAGTLKATIHLASSAQTVDLGPLIVVNLGQQ